MPGAPFLHSPAFFTGGFLVTNFAGQGHYYMLVWAQEGFDMRYAKTAFRVGLRLTLGDGEMRVTRINWAKRYFFVQKLVEGKLVRGTSQKVSFVNTRSRLARGRPRVVEFELG